jgi:hypothetical protein
MTFLVPPELLDAADRAGLEASAKGAAASGTPFLSFFTPDRMLALATEAGFKEVEHVSAAAFRRRDPTAAFTLHDIAWRGELQIMTSATGS